MRDFFDAVYPYAFGAFVFGIFIWKGPQAISYVAAQEWDMSSLYSSVFDLSSVLAAFLFAFFTFVRAAETEFIKKIKRTKIFRKFLMNLRTAIYASAICTLLTVPYIVIEPMSAKKATISFWFIGGWLALSACTFALSYRSVSQFVKLALAGTEYE